MEDNEKRTRVGEDLIRFMTNIVEGERVICEPVDYGVYHRWGYLVELIISPSLPHILPIHSHHVKYAFIGSTSGWLYGGPGKEMMIISK